MVFEDLGESVNASADIIFAFLRKCHTQRVASCVIDVEGMARNIDHFGLLNRFRQNGLAIEALRQNDPEEQAAGRPGPLNAITAWIVRGRRASPGISVCRIREFSATAVRRHPGADIR